MTPPTPRQMLIGGVLGTLMSFVAALFLSLHAALYVPICQPGTRWVWKEGCRLPIVQVWVAIGAGLASAVLALFGVIAHFAMRKGKLKRS